MSWRRTYLTAEPLPARVMQSEEQMRHCAADVRDGVAVVSRVQDSLAASNKSDAA